MATQTFKCNLCEKDFERGAGKRIYKFCSRFCAAKFNAQGQRTYEAIFNRWVEKFGEEEAKIRLERNKKRRSELALVGNMGRVLSEETKQKISKSCTGISNALKGKTFEEFYGAERGKLLGEQHSKKLKEGFASGRLTSNGRSAYSPIFRGIRLRSKLEQLAIEFLEKRDCLSFGSTLLYEVKAIRFQWIDEFEKSHTYQPDLYDVVNNIIYEVKPAWRVDRPTLEMNFKRDAVVNSGYVFRYLTDRDIKRSITRNYNI